MADKGWIKLHRCIRKNILWPEKQRRPFTHLEAWIDLLLEANHEPNYVTVDLQRIFVDRGQTLTSEIKLAERWKWSRNKVRRFILNMEKNEKSVTKNSTTKYTILTIVNYGVYQDGDTTNDTTVETPHDTTVEHQKNSRRNTNKNDKNDKNDKKINTPIVPKGTERFEIFWKSYPKKVGKGAAEKAWKKIKPSKDLLQTILTAIEQQKKSDQWQKDNGQYIPNPATWLNQKRWEDEPDKPDKPKKTKYDDIYL